MIPAGSALPTAVVVGRGRLGNALGEALPAAGARVELLPGRDVARRPELAADPRFILLDEPFAGVDPLSVVDIQRIIAHLKERGIGVLITDHNVRETLGICDRAYIVTEGHTIAEGDPESILQDRRVREVYLGEDFKL